jgi:GNAT superfamily N-acetyltransferase
MNPAGFAIELLDGAGALAAVPELARIHIECVAGGGGVSFMHPLSPEKAERFWRGEVAPKVAAGETALLVARKGGRIIGTVQVLMAMRENQPHRAEIAKMMVAPAERRKGVARALMETAQKYATEAGKTLWLLDTETGGLAEQLYISMGWQEIGVVPGFALTPHGEPCATTFLYKVL